MLLNQNYYVNVFLINFNNNISSDTKINTGLIEYKEISELHQLPDLSNYDVIIDSIFGTGLSREIQGDFKVVIEKINSSNKPIISIDIPSGMLSDYYSNNWLAIKSDLCITINSPKGSFFFPENNTYLKNI